MEPTRRVVILGLAAAASCRGPSPLERGARWLAAQQSPDGAFRSATYGFLRGGASLTGLAVLALAGARQAGADVPSEALSRGLGFLVASRAADGSLGWGVVPDYPTYATALAVSALARIGAPGWQEAAGPMVGWLLAQQLRGEAWGEHPGRGGFPMGSPQPRTPPHAGHVDLSMTRRALRALRAFGVDEGHPVWAEARAFVLRCHTADGGFRYSPVEDGVNKGADPRAGYGTATCDGVLALRAIGGPSDAEQAGVGFLVDRFRADENPGIGGAFAAYGPAMRFYWRAGAAEVLADRPAGWRTTLEQALIADQQADGSWRNERAEQKEDDPMVATCLALHAYGTLRG